jgi:transposase
MESQSIRNEVILGVDTHLDTHVGAVITSAGKLLGTLITPTTAASYLAMLAWARSLGAYNALVSKERVRTGQGVEGLEVNRPDRAKRRLKGKSDPIDAENAARLVLADNATAIPKDQSVRSRLCALFRSPGAVRSRRRPKRLTN